MNINIDGVTRSQRQTEFSLRGGKTSGSIYQSKPDNYWLEPAGPLVGKCHLEGNLIENHLD